MVSQLPAGNPADRRDQSDPDIDIYRDGQLVARGISGAANLETFTTPVLAGPDIFVADLREFRYADTDSSAAFPDRVRFDVSMTPVP